MEVRFVMRSSAVRPRPSGTSVVVSEMPSAASRYGILATDAADAWTPCESRPCIGLAPGANGSPWRRPSGVFPVLLPYTAFDVIVRIDCVWTALRYVGYLQSLFMNVVTTHEARWSTRLSLLPNFGNSPSVLKSVTRPV